MRYFENMSDPPQAMKAEQNYILLEHREGTLPDSIADSSI